MSTWKKELTELLDGYEPVSLEKIKEVIKPARNLNSKRDAIDQSFLWEILDILKKRTTTTSEPGKKEVAELNFINAMQAFSDKNLIWNEGIPNYSREGNRKSIDNIKAFNTFSSAYRSVDSKNFFAKTLRYITPIKIVNNFSCSYFFEANWGVRFLSVAHPFQHYNQVIDVLDNGGFDFNQGLIIDSNDEEKHGNFEKKKGFYKHNKYVSGWTYVFASGDVEKVKYVIDKVGIPEDPLGVMLSLMDFAHQLKATVNHWAASSFDYKNVVNGMKLLEAVAPLNEEEFKIVAHNKLTQKTEQGRIFKKNTTDYHNLSYALGFKTLLEFDWRQIKVDRPLHPLILMGDSSSTIEEKRKVYEVLKAENLLTEDEIDKANEQLKEINPKFTNIGEYVLAGQLNGDEPFYPVLDHLRHFEAFYPSFYHAEYSEENKEFILNHPLCLTNKGQLNYWFDISYESKSWDGFVAENFPELLVSEDKEKSPLAAMILMRMIYRNSMPMRVNIRELPQKSESYQGFSMEALCDACQNVWNMKSNPFIEEILPQMTGPRSTTYWGERVALSVYQKDLENLRALMKRLPENYRFDDKESFLIIRALASGQSNRNESFVYDGPASLNNEDQKNNLGAMIKEVWPRITLGPTTSYPLRDTFKKPYIFKENIFLLVAATSQEKELGKKFNSFEYWNEFSNNYAADVEVKKFNSLVFLMQNVDPQIQMNLLKSFVSKMSSARIDSESILSFSKTERIESFLKEYRPLIEGLDFKRYLSNEDQRKMINHLQSMNDRIKGNPNLEFLSQKVLESDLSLNLKEATKQASPSMVNQRF